jgi:tetratricopeptide (TPR) repeat protein
VRIGHLDQAVEHYEKAVDLYREAYLPNNAIAVCKQIIRNVPDRHMAYLKIGQIRAEQGFLPDARTNFLTYAERMQQTGDLDESFRALIEFCDLAPDDVGVRVTVADQMAANGRSEEAVEQLLIAHRHLTQLDEREQAEEVETKILAIDPEADIGAIPSSVGDDGVIVAEFGEIALRGDALGDSEEGEVESAVGEAMEEDAGDSAEEEAAAEVEAGDDGAFEIASGDEVEEESSVELPTMDFEVEAADEEEEAVELPTMDFEVEAADEDKEAVELPTMDFEVEADDQEAVELSAVGEADDPVPGADIASAFDAGDSEAVETSEIEVVSSAEAVEEALEEAAAEAPGEVESPAGAEADGSSKTEEKVPDEGYIDLGAMILGTDTAEKSTRFTVAYEEPSGDEDADFAKMLSQFEEKVSENLDASDVRAHYDLGTAYKEMGLLEEAIGSYQAALRAAPDHLPTYELMARRSSRWVSPRRLCNPLSAPWRRRPQSKTR